jgi:hypothetical protein
MENMITGVLEFTSFAVFHFSHDIHRSLLHRNSRTTIEDPWIRNSTKPKITLLQFLVSR